MTDRWNCFILFTNLGSKVITLKAFHSRLSSFQTSAVLTMVTTEIFTMPLLPGSDVGDPTTNAALIAWESFETIVKHNGGHKINFGTQRESPQTFEVFIST
jgi:hypothetical protein